MSELLLMALAMGFAVGLVGLIIAGFGRGPLAEHWQPTYADQRARLAPIYPGRCRPNGELV